MTALVFSLCISMSNPIKDTDSFLPAQRGLTGLAAEISIRCASTDCVISRPPREIVSACRIPRSSRLSRQEVFDVVDLMRGVCLVRSD